MFDCDVRRIAASLKVSVRTLQRQLKKENVTYKLIFDGLKKEIAIDQIVNYDTNLCEHISYVRVFRAKCV